MAPHHTKGEVVNYGKSKNSSKVCPWNFRATIISQRSYHKCQQLLFNQVPPGKYGDGTWNGFIQPLSCCYHQLNNFTQGKCACLQGVSRYHLFLQASRCRTRPAQAAVHGLAALHPIQSSTVALRGHIHQDSTSQAKAEHHTPSWKIVTVNSTGIHTQESFAELTTNTCLDCG